MAKKSKEEDKTLGKRIELLRVGLGISMNTLAKRVGVSHVQISNYESDAQSPTSTILLKIADQLDTSTDYLLKGTPTSELAAYFERVKTLPGEEQRRILEYIQERFEIDNYRKLKLTQFGDVIERNLLS